MLEGQLHQAALHGQGEIGAPAGVAPVDQVHDHQPEGLRVRGEQEQVHGAQQVGRQLPGDIDRRRTVGATDDANCGGVLERKISPAE